MVHEELIITIANQEAKIKELEKTLRDLKEWSDLNDNHLREMIDALTEAVDRILERGCCCCNCGK